MRFLGSSPTFHRKRVKMAKRKTRMLILSRKRCVETRLRALIRFDNAITIYNILHFSYSMKRREMVLLLR